MPNFPPLTAEQQAVVDRILNMTEGMPADVQAGIYGSLLGVAVAEGASPRVIMGIVGALKDIAIPLAKRLRQ